MRAKGISAADVETGLRATFGHVHGDLGVPEFEYALQDLPLLSPQQLREARAGCADTHLCTAVHLMDACRGRLQGTGQPDKLMRRLEAWLLARQHSHAVVRMVTGHLQEALRLEQ